MRVLSSWTTAISVGAPRMCCYTHRKANARLCETLGSATEIVSKLTMTQNVKGSRAPSLTSRVCGTEGGEIFSGV